MEEDSKNEILNYFSENDKNLNDEISSEDWNVKIKNKFIEFETKEGESKSKKIIMISNKNFIGALNFYLDEYKMFCFMYKGYGLNKNQTTFEKGILNIIDVYSKNLKLIPEYPEPNPLNEDSEKMETDSEEDEEEQ